LRILVTGASGYIGKQLVKRALENNHQIVSASRKPLKGMHQWLPFDLNDSSDIKFPDGIDVVVHLAANISTEESTEEYEVQTARNLIAKASAVDAKFIFVSSQTAREDAPTRYGRVKWLIEQEVLLANGLVVRFGQVYGGFEQGLFGTLVNLVRRFPVLPAFFPPPLVQPIHIDDCVSGLLKLVELKGERPDVYKLGSPDPVTFTRFLNSISHNRVRVTRLFIPVPIFMVSLVTKVLGEKLTTRIGLHQLNSLFDLPSMNTAADLDTIRLKLRPLSSGMHRSGDDHRRRLVREGIVLLTYLLKNRPDLKLVRRYVRMIEQLRAGTPLDLPNWLFLWPTSLALIDNSRINDSPTAREFNWRIDAATVIAEASKQGAIRFIGDAQSTWRISALLRIIIALCSEVIWRMFGLVFPYTFLDLSKKSSYDE
jgi:NADH dehydrogenase